MRNRWMVPWTGLQALFSLVVVLSCLTSCTTYQPFDRDSARSHPVEEQPAVPEMAKAAGKGRTAFVTDAKGVAIPVHIYGEENRGAPVLLLHGLQSHSGWFVQSAAHIASLGLPVYQIDRRGSGLSSEPRGHADSYEEMLDDVLTVARHAMKRHGAERFHLLGHCFGAIPATAFGVRHPELLQSLILCTPAIFTETSVYLKEALQIVKSEISHKHKYLPIHIDPAQFTESETYLGFIKGDGLTLKQVTTALYFQVPMARKYIEKNQDQLTVPIFMGMAAKDTICDNGKNRQFFSELPSGRRLLITYPNAKHILEFSEDRDLFFSDLAAWFSMTTTKPSVSR